jgi:uncharacterized membrane protein
MNRSRAFAGFTISVLIPCCALPLFLQERVLPRALAIDRGLPLLLLALLALFAHWAVAVGVQDVPLARVAVRLWAAAARHPVTLLGSIFILGAGTFSLAALWRQEALQTSAFDLGIFDQAIWRAGRGYGLTTLLKGGRSILSDHFEPVLYLLTPLYHLWDNVDALLVLQAVALASAVVPLHRMARRRFEDGAWAWVFCLVFLAYLPLRSLALFDFHPEALAVPLLLWGLDGLEGGQRLSFALLIPLACLCKESTCAAVFGLGLTMMFFGAKGSGLRLLGLGCVALGGGLFVWAVHWVIPHFRGGDMEYLGRYAYLGSTLGELLLSPLRHPLIFFGHLLWPWNKIEYVILLLAPLAFLPLLAPVWLVAAAPMLLMNLLADYPKMQSIHNQYNAELIPFLMVAAMDGARRLLKERPTREGWLRFALVSLSLGFWGSGQPFAELLAPVPARAVQIVARLHELPRAASVAAQNDLFPQIAHRPEVTLLPDLGAATYAAFDFDAPLPPWNTSAEANRAQAATLIALGWETLHDEEGFLLLAQPDKR